MNLFLNYFIMLCKESGVEASKLCGNLDLMMGIIAVR